MKSKGVFKKPFFAHFAEPRSPLVHEEDALQRVLMCADMGIPVVFASGIMPGVSGPVTMAGSIAVGNAEVLSGLLIHQLRQPGAPFIYAIIYAGLICGL